MWVQIQVPRCTTSIRLRGGGDSSDNNSTDSTETEEELHHTLVRTCSNQDDMLVLVGYVLFRCDDTEPDEHLYFFRLLSVHGGTLHRVRLDPRAEVGRIYLFPQGGPYYMSFPLQWQRMDI